GHRRYVESLSSYARQFLSRMDKPPVDYIKGLSPAIAIEQRTVSSNPRSTVGSITEITDYLRLLFARLGVTISPVSGEPVTYDSVTDVVNYVLSRNPDDRVYILAPLPLTDRHPAKELELLAQMGFRFIYEEGQVLEIEDLLTKGTHEMPAFDEHGPILVVDRFKVRSAEDEDFQHRVADSIQTAYNEGNGECYVRVNDDAPVQFSERFEADGIQFEHPTVNLFNSNNPIGACPTCEGFGRIMGIDEELVIPDQELSVNAGAVRPWQGVTMSEYLDSFRRQALKKDFPLDRPYYKLTAEQKKLLWEGDKQITGINDFFDDLRQQSYKVQYRVLLARYRGYTTCPTCHGKRLRPEALYVKVHGYDFGDLMNLPINDLRETFNKIPFTDKEREIARRLLHEISSRLGYLVDVGLGYLTLDRKANTLSGGETQRINLATSLGSTLTGSLYILDEPSIGLHPRDNERLIAILKSLRDLGNTVIVVEHDEAIMREADYLIDMGPRAGEHGGEVVFSGESAKLNGKHDSLTSDYLHKLREVPLPEKRRKPKQFVEVLGASANNLKHIDVKFPLDALTVVTGVSGSGKTTLVKEILYPALARELEITAKKPGNHRGIKLPSGKISHVEMIDQRAVGRNQRSNPVTYVGAYDHIRDLFASQQLAKQTNLKPASFSFNVAGGRCDTCEGEGSVTVEMQFLPDIKLECETCNGRRFKQVVLEVTYNDKNIYEVLQLTVDEAVEFFAEEPKITDRLAQLQQVGLGYLRLGQSTATLSGGEAQRLKLASFLNRKVEEHTLYIFDEPTTGLHFYDIEILMSAFQQLVDAGNTLIVIEHNLDVIKCADWLVDLGPEGGHGGGEVVYAGPYAGIQTAQGSLTAPYLP
ncbi:MAG: excinuclease ABC subunit UvrA, partial [Bacteroidota bacterium]